MTKYNIGQELVLTEDIETEGCFGTKKLRKKGTKLYVSAKKSPVIAMYPNGDFQILKDADIEGFSVDGIAEFLYDYLKWHLPLEEFLENYDISETELKEHIGDGLEELGMSDNTGNRS